MAMSLLIIITTLLLKKDVPDSYKAFEVTNDLLYNESLPTILTPRQAASEPTWDQAVYYGNWLICLMNAPLETLTGWQSKWTTSTTRTLDIYGWERTRRTLGTQDDFDSLALSDIMEDLGISTTFSNWKMSPTTSGTPVPRTKQHKPAITIGTTSTTASSLRRTTTARIGLRRGKASQAPAYRRSSSGRIWCIWTGRV